MREKLVNTAHLRMAAEKGKAQLDRGLADKQDKRTAVTMEQVSAAIQAAISGAIEEEY